MCDKAIEECKAIDLKIRNCIVVYNVTKEHNGSSSPALKKSKGHEVSKTIVSWLFVNGHPSQSMSAVIFYLIWIIAFISKLINLKTLKHSPKNTWNTWKLNNKHNIKPYCPARRNHDGCKNRNEMKHSIR